MRNEFSWTDAQVKALEKLWAEGLTAKAIGKVFGVTRSAVLGKVHRLSLPARFIASAKPRTCERVLETPPRKHFEREEQRLHPRKPGEPPPRLRLVVSDRPSKREVDILHLEHEHCRWPRADASAPGGYVFCGAQRSDVSAYCAEHNAIAFQPKKPARGDLVRKT